MAISSNYSTSYYLGSTNTSDAETHKAKFKEVQKEFQSLSSDLSSGNLSGAQTTFAQLQQDLPTPPSGSSTSSTSSSGSTTGTSGAQTVQNDMVSLSQALGSNNLSGAQTAYAQLQKDLPPPPPADGSGGGPASGSSSSSSTSGAQSSSQDPVATAIASLSSALSSNNLTDAQTAFKTLEKLFQQDGSGSSATSAYAQNSSYLTSQSGTGSLAVSA